MSVVEPLVRPSSFTVPSDQDANIPTGLLVQPFGDFPMAQGAALDSPLGPRHRVLPVDPIVHTTSTEAPISNPVPATELPRAQMRGGAISDETIRSKRFLKRKSAFHRPFGADGPGPNELENYGNRLQPQDVAMAPVLRPFP